MVVQAVAAAVVAVAVAIEAEALKTAVALALTVAIITVVGDHRSRKLIESSGCSSRRTARPAPTSDICRNQESNDMPSWPLHPKPQNLNPAGNPKP